MSHINDFFPCCSQPKGKLEPAKNKNSCSSALSAPMASLISAIIFGSGAALAAYFLTNGSLLWSAVTNGGVGLFSGLVTFVFLRCVLAKKIEENKPPKKPTQSPKPVLVPPPASNKEEKDWTGKIIETVHPYLGDLKSEEKSKIKTEQTEKTLKLSFEENSEFQVTIRQQDLLKSNAQVIVNAANTHLGGGRGIDGLINKQGGISYMSEHESLREKYDSQYVEGYAAIVESGALKEKFNIEKVIIVAGPQHESNPQNDASLYSCYYNSLVLAHNQNYTSIAFPGISTGIFGFPIKRAAAISLRAIHDFIEQYPLSPLKTISIHFLDKPEKNFGAYANAAST